MISNSGIFIEPTCCWRLAMMRCLVGRTPILSKRFSQNHLPLKIFFLPICSKLKRAAYTLEIWGLSFFPNSFKVGEKCVPVCYILTALTLGLTCNIYDVKLPNQLVPQISAEQYACPHTQNKTCLSHFARCQLCLLMPLLQDTVPICPEVSIALGYEVWVVLHLQLAFGESPPLLLSLIHLLFITTAWDFIITRTKNTQIKHPPPL